MLKAKKKLTRREIKEDKLVTFYFKAQDFYRLYQKWVHYGILAVVVLISLGIYIANSKQEAEEKASVELARGKAAYQNEDYDVAIDILSALTSDFSGTRAAAMGTLYLAKAYLAKKDYEQAEAYFRKYLDDYGDDPILKTAAAMGIAVVYDERGDFEKAAELYEEAAQMDKDSFKSNELLLAAARCYKLAGKKDEAARVLEDLLERKPTGQVATEARLYLSELRS